jgi:hypothetical protein
MAVTSLLTFLEPVFKYFVFVHDTFKLLNCKVRFPCYFLVNLNEMQDVSRQAAHNTGDCR